MEEIRKKYSAYPNDSQQVLDLLFAVHDASVQSNFIVPEEEENIWTLLDIFVQQQNKNIDNTPFSEVTLALVKIFPLETLILLKRCFSELFVFQVKESLSSSQNEKQNQPAVLKEKFTELFGETFTNKWLTTLQAQPENIQKNCQQFAFTVLPHLEQFGECIFLLGTWERYYTFVDPVYSLEELKDIFLTQKNDQYDVDLLVYTLHDYFIGKEAVDIVGWLFETLNSNYKEATVQIDWLDAAFLTIYLHFVFSHFSLFIEERRLILLSTFAYRASLAGVNLQKILQEDLYETYTVSDYVEVTLKYIDAIKKNTETILFDQQKVTMLGTILSGPSPEFQANQKLLSPEEQKAFQKVASLFALLESGKLIEKNHRGDQPEVIARERELTDLITWFADENDWEKFSRYYAKVLDPLPLSALLIELKENINLEKEVAEQKILQFNDFLHQALLLPKDQDIIEFFESDNTFHWNEKLTT